MIEDKIWEDPNKYIIGSDEVGRGCFAGPICASAVKINYSHIRTS
jgi:ribonuclease HII